MIISFYASVLLFPEIADEPKLVESEIQPNIGLH